MLKKENIKFLIVHCSDTPDTDNIGAYEIHKMHLGFGWDGIGYHRIIKRDGQIQNGRPDYWVGAHTKGLNKESLGVCLIGRFNFADEQFNSLYKLLIHWKKEYPNSLIKGHSEAIRTKKTCPNFDLQKWCLERNIF